MLNVVGLFLLISRRLIAIRFRRIIVIEYYLVTGFGGRPKLENTWADSLDWKKSIKQRPGSLRV